MIRLYLQRLAVGLTAPVLTYMALSLLVTENGERLILLAGSAWCAAVWVCYFLAQHLRGPTHHT